MQKFTCALVIAIVVVVVGQINCDLLPGFERCDNTTSQIESFFVSSCPNGATDLACKMKRGKKVTFALDFTSGLEFKSVNSKINMEGMGYSYDACAFGLVCPSSVGQKQSMVQKIRIHDTLPARKSDTMEFYLFDIKTHEHVVCIKFPIQVV